jgi:peptidoglycan/xylan/chitin deacetylase (PgdA/CDA1 family)
VIADAYMSVDEMPTQTESGLRANTSESPAPAESGAPANVNEALVQTESGAPANANEALVQTESDLHANANKATAPAPVSAGAYANGDDATAPDEDEDEAPTPEVASVSIDADELLFGKKGATLKLKTEVEPEDEDADEDEYTGTIKLKYKSSDTSIAVVNENGVVKAKGWGTCVITARAGGEKDRCKVTVAKKWIAVTFDDGPGRYTDKLLKFMKKQGVRSTFFVVGRMAESRTSVLKKMVMNGNEIGNHTYLHNGSADVLMGALNKTDRIVRKATGKSTALMRPPGGAINGVTRRCGKPIILWSVDPKDWRDRNADTVYRRVMSGAKSGAIVLLHDIHSTSVDASFRIIKSLKDKGYALVTVSDLLKSPKDNKVYNKGPGEVRTMKIKYYAAK